MINKLTLISIIFINILFCSCLKLQRNNPYENNPYVEKPNMIFDKYEIVSDDNKNGIINKGETIYLNIYLKNTGNANANSVYPIFNINSSYVSSSYTPFYSYTTYETIKPGKSESSNYSAYIYNIGTVNYTLRFSVSSNTPSSTTINIIMTIKDNNNNTWTDNFNVKVF